MPLPQAAAPDPRSGRHPRLATTLKTGSMNRLLTECYPPKGANLFAGRIKTIDKRSQF